MNQLISPDPKTHFFLGCSYRQIFGLLRPLAFVVALLMALPIASAMADAVTLAWDANNPAPEGYRVYMRVDGGSYDYDQWSCQVTAASCTIDNLAPDTTYHFVVRAYTQGDVSDNSNEASYNTAVPSSTYTISASADANGRISPSGKISVTEEEDQEFTFTPNTGYHISDVLVDDRSVGAVTSYRFEKVADHHSIKVIFEQTNRNPNADAGPDQTAGVGTDINLDGGNSSDPDPDDTIMSYRWRQISGTGVQIIGAQTARAQFTAPDVGTGGEALEFELHVTDQSGASATDRCFVNVTKNNSPPQANAGGQVEVNEGDSVILDGTGSMDPDTDPMTFRWEQILGPTVTLKEAHTAQPIFSAPEVGTTGATLKFQLTVVDDKGLKNTDISIVNVIWVNSPPKADAGKIQTVSSDQLVYLDGTGSTDPDGNLNAYLWTQTSGPTVTLSSPTSNRPSFLSPKVETDGTALAFELVVSDTEGATSNDACLVNVQVNTIHDSDGDGYADNIDAFPEDANEWLDSDEDGIGDIADMDDDDDGMLDTWEIQYGLDPLNPGDANLDSDNDGVANKIEAQSGSDPTSAEKSGDWTPVVTYPADGETQTSCSNPFIEIDANGTIDHDSPIAQTFWQILSQDGLTIVFSAVSDRHLSKIRIPVMTLAPDTAYICRVRCYDSNNQVSNWSSNVHFVTEKVDNDIDLDGIPDDREVAIGSNLDQSEEIATNFALVETSGIISVNVPADNPRASLESAMYFDPASIDEAADDVMPTPTTMVANKILTDTGDEVTLRIHFDKPLNPETLQWIQYDTVNGWQDDTKNARVEENSSVMEVTVKDGGHGDADGVANGTIINLSGPSTDAGLSSDAQSTDAALSKGTGSAAGSDSSQCFIGSLIQH